MTNMATNMMMGNMKDNITGGLNEAASKINWDDFNFPAGIPMIHFKPEEDQEETDRRTANRLRACWYGLIVFYIYNCILNTLGVFLTEKKINYWQPLYSICHMCLFVPLGLWTQYKGYRVLGGISGDACMYRISEFILIGLLGVAASIPMFGYHGFLWNFTVFKESVIEGFLILIENAFIVVIGLARIFTLLTLRRKMAENK